MMLPLTRLWPLLRWETAAAAGGAAAGGSPTTTTTEEEEEEDDDDEDDEDGGERPALPAEAPGSPAPSAAEARGFFRGGGEAPPVSESEEEEAEARVSSPREAVLLPNGVQALASQEMPILPSSLTSGGRSSLQQTSCDLEDGCHMLEETEGQNPDDFTELPKQFLTVYSGTLTKVSLGYPGQSTEVRTQLTAASTSWAQVIFLPQSPE
ncbi:uncharacterized protein [Macaca nemestrina]|uniref:uncharacterized protein n=1 Tax=Macaca nemestrina TaxID=9545 RepID=UPI0039B8763C